MSKVNIAEKFSKIHDYYRPHIAAELNGQQVKLVKNKVVPQFEISYGRTTARPMRYSLCG